jgi:hypothetical protein
MEVTVSMKANRTRLACSEAAEARGRRHSLREPQRPLFILEHAGNGVFA